jgi:hypothetical protein
MHVHLPKPLHGWREFAGEVGIIVLGVLIALTADQIAVAFQWHREVRSFRAAADHELGRDLGIYRSAMLDRSCAARRLAELEHFLDDSNTGRRDKLVRPIGRPFMQTLFFSVWDNRGSDVSDHLPLNLRTAYGELYDEFRNDEKVLLNERDVWRSLSQFEQPVSLDNSSQMRMRELLTRAEQFNATQQANYHYVEGLAEPLGIAPIPDPELKPPGPSDSFCQPLLAQK